MKIEIETKFDIGEEVICNDYKYFIKSISVTGEQREGQDKFDTSIWYVIDNPLYPRHTNEWRVCEFELNKVTE